MEWIKWKIEYDNQVYRNNFNEHVAITEVNVKCYTERKENKKNPVLNICRCLQERGNVSCS